MKGATGTRFDGMRWWHSFYKAGIDFLQRGGAARVRQETTDTFSRLGSSAVFRTWIRGPLTKRRIM